MNENSKTVVVVDDHQLIAKAISSIIEDFEAFHVIYECDNGLSLIEKMEDTDNIPDIVLLDISMPKMNGFETAKWLKEHHKQVLVMALSVQDDEESLIKMIQNGAKGYLHKNVHPDELEFALNELIKNGIYFPSWATSKMFHTLESPKTAKLPNKLHELSNREKEFLTYVCQDITYKEIGDKMCCSPRTIDGYRDMLFEKLELHSRVALALYAVKHGYYEI